MLLQEEGVILIFQTIIRKFLDLTSGIFEARHCMKLNCYIVIHWPNLLASAQNLFYNLSFFSLKKNCYVYNKNLIHAFN
jgi:hypothetical protein